MTQIWWWVALCATGRGFGSRNAHASNYMFELHLNAHCDFFALHTRDMNSTDKRNVLKITNIFINLFQMNLLRISWLLLALIAMIFTKAATWPYINCPEGSVPMSLGLRKTVWCEPEENVRVNGIRQVRTNEIDEYY